MAHILFTFFLRGPKINTGTEENEREDEEREREGGEREIAKGERDTV